MVRRFSEPLLKHHLKLSKGKPTKGTPLPSTSKAWKRFKGSVKVYLATVLQMLTQLTDENAELFVLTHAFHLCPYYASKFACACVLFPCIKWCACAPNIFACACHACKLNDYNHTGTSLNGIRPPLFRVEPVYWNYRMRVFCLTRRCCAQPGACPRFLTNNHTPVVMRIAVAGFPKLNRAFFKKILHLWSHGAETVRVKAFLVMRQLVIVSPYPFIEIALKGIYLTFVRNCKFPTPSMRPTLNFMLNSVVELFRLDLSAAYQHAFVYIRQLAVHRKFPSRMAGPIRLFALPAPPTLSSWLAGVCCASQ